MGEAAGVAPALWLVDKPAGPTSHDVVAAARRRLPRRTKVGHCGTLDPFATGLLVLAVGRATRLVPYLTALDKTYLATLRTGFTSETGDPEGPVEPAGAPASAGDLSALLPTFLGRTRQRVPAYSAVKVDGERLYRRARRGEAVEAPEREIEIHEIALAEDRGDGVFAVAVRCGKGTYIRQLAADIGEALGCGAYLTELRRTAVGAMSVEDAVAPDEVAAEGGLDPLSGLGHLARRELTEAEARDVAHGRPVPGGGGGGDPVALVRDGRLVAVARPSCGALRPAVVLGDAR
ncbi:MAG: tRNA pseudouridine(55) synthase TruB [Thermoleophilia bacterium]